MLVDDERDIVQVAVRALQMRGYNVTGFTDPVQATREFQQNQGKYSLVISDIRMPVMSGFELLLNVKRLNPNVKVILMTAYDYEKDQIKADFPVEEFLMKPLLPSQLIEHIDRHLRPDSGGSAAEMSATLHPYAQLDQPFKLTVPKINGLGYFPSFRCS